MRIRNSEFRILNSFLLLLLPCLGFAQVQQSFFGMDVEGSSNAPTVPIGSVRLWDSGVTWNAIEHTAGNYTFTTLDAFLSLAYAAGADVEINLAGTPNFYSSNASDTNCASNFANNAPTSNGACDPPSDIGSGDTHWKNFVTALVNHSLASSTAHIKAYVIWNEPNQDATHAPSEYWGGTNANLVTLTSDAAAIIHSLDPNALVGSPDYTDDGRYLNDCPSTGIGNFLAAGGTGFDFVAMHYYPHFFQGSVSGDYGADPEVQMLCFPQLAAVLSTYNVTKPVWITEGDWGGGTTYYYGAKPAPLQEAALLVKWHLLLMSQGVQRAYWYTWDAGITGSTCTIDWGGLIDNAGICQQGTTYQWLQSYLVGAKPANPFCSNGGDDTWSCLFTAANGHTAQFLWNINAATKILTLDPRFNACLNVDNSTCTITNHEVTVGANPVLLLMN